MTKKIVALVLSISITIISSACGAPDLGKLDNPKENAKGSRLGSTIGWIDSDIIGAIDENDNIRLEDDYAAAVNKEWKLSMGDTFHQVFQGTAGYWRLSLHVINRRSPTKHARHIFYIRCVKRAKVKRLQTGTPGKHPGHGRDV